MTETTETRRGPLFHCSTCGGATPANQVHRCDLTARQRRRLEAQQKANQRQVAAAMRVPEPETIVLTCPRCMATTRQGERHDCPNLPGEEIAQALRAAGYKVEKA